MREGERESWGRGGGSSRGMNVEFTCKARRDCLCLHSLCIPDKSITRSAQTLRSKSPTPYPPHPLHQQAPLQPPKPTPSGPFRPLQAHWAGLGWAGHTGVAGTVLA